MGTLRDFKALFLVLYQHTYFLVLEGCGPDSDPPAQQNRDTLWKSTQHTKGSLRCAQIYSAIMRHGAVITQSLQIHFKA